MNALERLTSLRAECREDGDRAGEIACFQVAAQFSVALEIATQNKFLFGRGSPLDDEEESEGNEAYRPACPRVRGASAAKKCTRRPRPNDKPTKEKERI